MLAVLFIKVLGAAFIVLLCVERSASSGPGDPVLGSSIPYDVEW
jgi:hypothetical protein